MPRHDFKCPACGAVGEVTLKITQRATEACIICRDCAEHRHQGVQMIWVVPSTVGFDCGSGSTFKAFSYAQRQPDGSMKEVHITSLHQMRQIERETETRARNGEGEATRFRMWSHDDSQGDVNSFGDDPSVQARKELAAMRQAVIESGGREREARLEKIVGAEAEHNAQTLGPGVTEETTGATMTEISLG